METDLTVIDYFVRTPEIYFSVVIPLYNKASFIARALASVTKQNYQNYEVLVVDDGSTDGGGETVRDLALPQVRLFSQTNRGVSAARNRGIEEARHPFVAFLDADDEWSPAFLTEIEEMIRAFPLAGVYGANHYYCFPDGKRNCEHFKTLFPEGQNRGYLDNYFTVFEKYSRSPFSNSGCCMPAKILREFGGYRLGVKMTEDSDLWCRIALKWPVAFTISPLCNYYLETPNSTIHLFEPKDYEASKMLQTKLNTEEIPEKYRDSVRRVVAFFQLSLAKRALLQSRKTSALLILFDRRVLIVYPLQFLALMVCVVLPGAMIRTIGRLKTKFLSPWFSI